MLSCGRGHFADGIKMRILQCGDIILDYLGKPEINSFIRGGRRQREGCVTTW